jgi:hypothetical protein
MNDRSQNMKPALSTKGMLMNDAIARECNGSHIQVQQIHAMELSWIPEMGSTILKHL